MLRFEVLLEGDDEDAAVVANFELAGIEVPDSILVAPRTLPAPTGVVTEFPATI